MRDRPKLTATPTYFTKPPTSLNGHNWQILKPADCEYLNYEGEYAVAIGNTCRNVISPQTPRRCNVWHSALTTVSRNILKTTC